MHIFFINTYTLRPSLSFSIPISILPRLLLWECRWGELLAELLLLHEWLLLLELLLLEWLLLLSKLLHISAILLLWILSLLLLHGLPETFSEILLIGWLLEAANGLLPSHAGHDGLVGAFCCASHRHHLRRHAVVSWPGSVA